MPETIQPLKLTPEQQRAIDAAKSRLNGGNKPGLTPAQQAAIDRVKNQGQPNQIPSQSPSTEENSANSPEETLDPSVIDRINHFLGGINRTILNTPADIAQGLGAVGTYGGNKLQQGVDLITGEEHVPADINDNPLSKVGEAYKQGLNDFTGNWGQNENISNAEGAEGFLMNDIPQGIGSIVSVLMTGGESLLGKGALATADLTMGGLGNATKESLKTLAGGLVSKPGIVGSMQMAVPEYQRAIAEGASEDEAFAAFAGNYLLGSTERLPLENMFKRINLLSGGKIVRALKSGSTTAVEESLQEGIQQYLSNKVAAGTYDPDRDPMDGVLRSMLVGAVLGKVLGVGTSLATKENYNPTEEQIATKSAIADEIISNTGLGIPDPKMSEEIDKAAAIEPQQGQVIQAAAEQQEVSSTNNFQLTVKDVHDRKLPVVTEHGTKGVITVTPGGMMTIRSGKIIEELGNVNEIGSQQIDKLGISLQDKAGKPFDGETVTVKVADALKDQVRVVANAMTKGVRKGQSLIKEHLTKLQNIAKASNMSPRQVSAIVTKIKNTNLFSGEAGVKLNSFIDKITQDAEYANKVAEARKLQSAIKGNKRNRAKLTTPEQSVYSDFSFIDPTEVDIDEYLKKAHSLSQSAKPVKIGEKFTPAPVVELNDYNRSVIEPIYNKEIGKSTPELSVSQMIREIKQKQTEDKARKSAEMEAGADFTEEINTFLNNDSDGKALERSTKGAEVKKQLTAMADAVQREMPAQPPSVISLDGNTFSQQEADKIFEELKGIDTNLLNLNQLKALIKTISKINANGDYGDSGMIAVLGKQQREFKLLKDKFKGFTVVKIASTQMKFGSLSMMTQAFTGTTDDAALFQLYTGMTGISDATASASAAREQMTKIIEDLRKRFPSAFKNDMNLYRRGVYKTLIEYAKGENPAQALKENKQLLEDNIIAYLKHGDKEAAAKLEKLYAPFRNAETIEDVQRKMAAIDPAGKQVYETIAEQYKKYDQKVKDHNYFYWNKTAPSVENYTGKKQYFTADDASRKHGFEFTEEELNKMMSPVDYSRSTKPAQTGSARARTGINDDPTKKGYRFINLNMDGIAISSVEKTVFGIESVPHMIQVEYNKENEDAFKEMLGAAKNDKAASNADKIFEGLFDPDHGTYSSFVKSSVGKRVNHDEATKIISKWTNFFREVGYTATLGGVSQYAKQHVVLTNAAVQLGTDVKFLFNSWGDLSFQKEDVNNFLKGHSVAYRKQTQAIGHINETVEQKNINKQAQSLLVNLSEGVIGKSGRFLRDYIGGLKFLTNSDAHAAEVSYLAFYRQHLQKNNKTFAGWKREAELSDTPARKEAHAYAKIKVDILQTASNPNEQSASVKSNDLSSVLVKQALIPYGTFALNQKLRLVGDYQALLHGDTRQRKAALVDLMATATETIMFKSVSWGSRALLGGLTWKLLESLGGEDDRDEEQKANESAVEKENAIGDLVASGVTDFMPGIFTAPEQVKNLMLAGINYGSYLLAQHRYPDEYDEMNLKDYQREVGKVVPLFEKDSDPINEAIGMVGVFGTPVKTVMDVNDTFDMLKKNVENLTPAEQSFMKASAVLDLLSIGKLAPADVRFAVRKRAREIIRRRSGNERTPTGIYSSKEE